MKFKKLKAAAALALAFAMLSPTAAPIVSPVVTAQAAAVKLNVTKKTLTVGDTVQLKLTGTKKSITWSSSKKSVAAVNKNGLVRAKAAGKATITATCSKKTYKCAITVKKASSTTTYKNKSVDGFKFIYPANWTSESDSTNGTITFATANKEANPTKLAMFMCIPTGTKAIDYSIFKSTFVSMYNEDLLESTLEGAGLSGVTVSNMKTSDYKSSHGTCMQMKFNVNYAQEETSVKANCVLYLLSVDNYMITAIGMVQANDTTTFLTSQTAKMLNGMTIPKS